MVIRQVKEFFGHSVSNLQLFWPDIAIILEVLEWKVNTPWMKKRIQALIDLHAGLQRQTERHEIFTRFVIALTFTTPRIAGKFAVPVLPVVLAQYFASPVKSVDFSVTFWINSSTKPSAGKTTPNRTDTRGCRD